MRRMIAISITLLLLAIPARLFAKGDTVKITIKGGDLIAPIEITDPRILANFQVWTGPGTGSDAPGFNPNEPSFIIDWSQGPISEPPERLERYEVSFYAKMHNQSHERLIYVVSYAFDGSMQQSYVYLPGKADEHYRLNVSTIFRGLEGNWFRAWSLWENVAGPLIRAGRAKGTASNAGRNQSSR